MCRIFLMLLIVVSLSGCSGPIYIYIYNNINSALVVTVSNDSITIEPNSKRSFKAVKNFEVCSDGKLYTYSINSNLPPGKYYGKKHFPKYSVHFQFQSGGMLYLAMPEAQMPLKSAEQPKGFPVSPSMVSGCNA